MFRKTKNKNGELFVSSGVKILISIIIGALLLSTTYLLAKDTVMPTAKEKIEGLFNYSQGSEIVSEETAGLATFSDGSSLTWEELMLPENGSKYGYDAEKITATSIGNNAFENCTQLTDIVIQNGVTSIGINAFGSCYNLKSVQMPNSVTDLSNFAFNYCSSLTDINISSGVTSLSKGLFSECGSLKTIIVPNSVTQIGQLVFQSCMDLESVTLSSNLESIDYHAFRETFKLKEIHFPASITTLKWGSFSDSCITDFYYAGTKAQWNSIDKNNWAQYLSGYTVHCSDGDV